MSHFLVMVIGSDVEEQLARYDENLDTEEYSLGLVPEGEKEEMMKFYKTKGGYSNFDECYQLYGEAWNGNRWKKNEMGKWESFSSYNPDSKWDWYQVGGRWAGSLELKDGVKPLVPVNFSFGWSNEEKERVIADNRADVAYKKDIANIDSIVPFAVVIEGEWYERATMHWWAVTTNEVDADIWKEQVKNLLSCVKDDELIIMVDCHI